MRWVIVAAVVLAGLGSLGACNKAPSEDDCKQLLDHMVDLELKKSGTGGTDAAKADLAKAKASIVDAKLTDGYVEKCTKNTPRARVGCALNAADLDGVARCDEGK
jgi:hypothetical protein